MTDLPRQGSTCELCGEPMPEGEVSFRYHGYSGPCPKPPLPRTGPSEEQDLIDALFAAQAKGVNVLYADAVAPHVVAFLKNRGWRRG